MSRIAYIISAYKDAPHLARLVAALDDRADFYVHIDLNADIHPFEDSYLPATDERHIPSEGSGLPHRHLSIPVRYKRMFREQALFAVFFR